MDHRGRPRIDKSACPCLTKGFIDKDEEIVYVPFDEVKTKVKKLKTIPFDSPDVEPTRCKDECTIEYFLKKYKVDDLALKILAFMMLSCRRISSILKNIFAVQQIGTACYNYITFFKSANNFNSIVTF